MPTFVVQTYIADLTDEELLMRPHEKANHIDWLKFQTMEYT